MEHVVEASKPVPPPKKSAARPILLMILCVPLLAASAYSWVARPAWIWGISEVSTSPLQEEAAARLGLIAIAQRIEAHREQSGRLPGSLEEIEAPTSGVFYSVVNPTVFELRTTHAQGVVVFRSDEPIDAFLGNSAAVIARGTPR